jgi:hypothetical protein
MLFEIHGLILALHHDARFLRHPVCSTAPDAASAAWCATARPRPAAAPPAQTAARQRARR